MTNTTSPTLKRVLKGDLCSGCGLCAGLAPDAIALEAVAPGYTRPRQHAPISLDTERLIAAACPGSTVAPWQEAAHRHPYWGPWIDSVVGHSTDTNVRHVGSSGGAISALALHAIGNGMVDRVLHIEADPEHPTHNRIRWSSTVEEVLSGAGSRYASSSPLATIDEALGQPGRIAFIGKPCDVSALRQLGTVDARVAERVPIMLSFFCGGMPSHDGADRIVSAMGLQPEALVSFRYRGNGWPGMTRAETRDGSVKEMRYADSWGRHLSKQVQFRCKICPDAVGGAADIACADAWYGGESGYPSFDEQAGRSLILTRTDAGVALLQSALNAGAIEVEKLAIGEIDLMQPSQARRKRLVWSRLAACSSAFQPRPVMKGLDVSQASARGHFKEKARNFLGTLLRIARNAR